MASPATHPASPDAAAGPPLMEVTDLVKHFPITKGLLRRTVGHVRAVDGVSFTIGAGETVAIMGPSGSGKSTLLHCMSGVLLPDLPRLERQLRGLVEVSWRTRTGASTKYQHRNRRARRQGKGHSWAYILCELDLPTLHEVGRECHHRERLLLPVPFVARERGDAHPVLRTVVEDAVGVFPVAPGASGFLVKPIQGFLHGRSVSACRVKNSVSTHRELRHK